MKKSPTKIKVLAGVFAQPRHSMVLYFLQTDNSYWTSWTIRHLQLIPHLLSSMHLTQAVLMGPQLLEVSGTAAAGH